MIRTIAAPIGALLLAGLVSEPRQNPPSALQTFRTGVDIVQVDVSVLDRDRRPVRGLAAADFTVLEDGQERPVVAFSAVDLPAPAVTDSFLDARRIARRREQHRPIEGRLVVILMDRTIRPQMQPLGRRIAEAAVNALGPGDLAAVIYSGPGVPQNFTSDRGLLLAAINRPFITLRDRDMGNPGECYCGTCYPRGDDARGRGTARRPTAAKVAALHRRLCGYRQLGIQPANLCGLRAHGQDCAREADASGPGGEPHAACVRSAWSRSRRAWMQA